MKSKVFGRAVGFIAVIVLAVSASAFAQPQRFRTFHGVINDFTPASAPVNGPWEVRGPWSLTLNDWSRKAEFSAALTMERSDAGVTQSGGGDLDNPMDRMAHTHHITLVDGQVVPTATGFQVTGYATITKDGAFPPPFGPVLPKLTIEITGGTGEGSVRFSNITVLFADPAAGHFGTNPIHGVIRSSDYR